MVWVNVPNLAITPAVRALGSNAEFAAALLGEAYNAGLDQTLTALQALPQIQFVRLDVPAIFAELLAAPGVAGLTDVNDPCLTFGVVAQALCDTPNRYLFWDGIHPTTAGHGYLAQKARTAVAP
jgi:phospholipase/lecithinase/hemolysin